MPGFLEQRHVDKRRRIALSAWIPVPVPRPAEVAALLDDADGNTGLRQPRGGGEPRETAPDERERDMISLRLAWKHRRIRIFKVVVEPPLDLKVLIVSVGAQPLVALLTVFLPEPLLVDPN